MAPQQCNDGRDYVLLSLIHWPASTMQAHVHIKSAYGTPSVLVEYQAMLEPEESETRLTPHVCCSCCACRCSNILCVSVSEVHLMIPIYAGRACDARSVEIVQ